MASCLDRKVKQLVVMTREKKDLAHYKEFHSHSLDLSQGDAVSEIFQTAKTRFASVHGVVMLTGEFDYSTPLLLMNRRRWDELVENYVLIPALITREVVGSSGSIRRFT